QPPAPATPARPLARSSPDAACESLSHPRKPSRPQSIPSPSSVAYPDTALAPNPAADAHRRGFHLACSKCARICYLRNSRFDRSSLSITLSPFVVALFSFFCSYFEVGCWTLEVGCSTFRVHPCNDCVTTVATVIELPPTN